MKNCISISVLYLFLACFGLSGLLPSAEPQKEEIEFTYKSSFTSVVKLGMEIQKILEDKYKGVINEIPVFLETDVMPYVRPTEYTVDNKPLRAVFISAGFIDLMNLVAHAKAIDSVQKGYFEKYILILAKESGAKELAPLPGVNDKRFWSENVLNAQKSYFNQMVGMVLGIELSHHYLGHYKKYVDKLENPNGKPVPINNLLTPTEWDESLKAGVKSALECGFGVDGLKALYDAINKMPQRPAWTAYFLPQNTKVDKIKKDLEKLEKKFFAGEL